MWGGGASMDTCHSSCWRTGRPSQSGNQYQTFAQEALDQLVCKIWPFSQGWQVLPRAIEGSLLTSPSLPETDSHSTSVTVHTALSEQISTIRRFWRGQCGKIVMGLSNAAKLALTAPALITKHQTGTVGFPLCQKRRIPKTPQRPVQIWRMVVKPV